MWQATGAIGVNCLPVVLSSLVIHLALIYELLAEMLSITFGEALQAHLRIIFPSVMVTGKFLQ